MSDDDQISTTVNRTYHTDTTANQTTKTGDRTTKQSITVPSLEKSDSHNAKLWWRKIIQLMKMSHQLDLSEMTTDKKIKLQYRDHLEAEIKDTFISALAESAMEEVTKTVREKDPNTLPLHKLYTLFRLHFTLERNKHHRRAPFWGAKRTKRYSSRRPDETIGNRKKNLNLNKSQQRNFLLRSSYQWLENQQVTTNWREE